MVKVKTEKAASKKLFIPAPNLQTVRIKIKGTAPLVMNKFSQKAKQGMIDDQMRGKTATKRKREPKDFNANYEASKHISSKGWCGIPAPAFRNSMIETCRLVDIKMTQARRMLFIEADDFDTTEGTPLVKITKGKPYRFDAQVRLPNGAFDIRARAMWDSGWEAELRITFNADFLTIKDITNLLSQAGLMNGILEGRPGSRNSSGMGWGLFKIIK